MNKILYFAQNDFKSLTVYTTTIVQLRSLTIVFLGRCRSKLITQKSNEKFHTANQSRLLTMVTESSSIWFHKMLVDHYPSPFAAAICCLMTSNTKLSNGNTTVHSRWPENSMCSTYFIRTTNFTFPLFRTERCHGRWKFITCESLRNGSFGQGQSVSHGEY